MCKLINFIKRIFGVKRELTKEEERIFLEKLISKIKEN